MFKISIIIKQNNNIKTKITILTHNFTIYLLIQKLVMIDKKWWIPPFTILHK